MERYFDVNSPGYSIKCKLYCNDIHTIKKVVIFGHGFGGHKDNKAAAKFAERLLSKYKSFAVLTFDWPCHGDDVRKKLTLDDCSTYLSLVVDYIKDRFQTEELYAYATSFGGYLFLKYMIEKENPFRKIALRCPAIRMYDSITQNIMHEEEWDKLRKGKEALIGFDRKIKINQEFLDELKEADITKYDYLDFADDILILHGTKDEVVPFETTEEFAENNVIELIPVENADHRFIDPKKMDFAIQKIILFFGNALEF